MLKYYYTAILAYSMNSKKWVDIIIKNILSWATLGYSGYSGYSANIYICVCVCVWACMWACVYTYERVCVHACYNIIDDIITVLMSTELINNNIIVISRILEIIIYT